MYSTCTFCNRALGNNDVIEHFPVGRRVAFDAEKGRLWVVCRNCAGWNLSPFEERWEAIEDAERLFRGTHLRVSTDNIGLARARDGTDLVRVGKPQRPELAAWRYGAQFSHRRRKHLVTAGFVGVGAAAALAGGVAAGIGAVAMWQVGRMALLYADHGFPESVVTTVRGPRGNVVKVRRRHLRSTSIAADGNGGLMIKLDTPEHSLRLRGEEGRQVAASLFRAVNGRGGSDDDVQSAVGRLTRAGSAEQFLHDTARRGEKLSRVVEFKANVFGSNEEEAWTSGLLALGTGLSLAIEMALHEEQERRALEGELAELERAWREAEEIGAISDSLLLPAGLDRIFDQLKKPLG